MQDEPARSSPASPGAGGWRHDRTPSRRHAAGWTTEPTTPPKVSSAAIAPIHTDLLRQARVQREAAARERLERRPVAPVERKKSARLAGGRTGDVRSLDDDGLRPTTAQEVRDRCPDDPATDRSTPSRIISFYAYPAATGRLHGPPSAALGRPRRAYARFPRTACGVRPYQLAQSGSKIRQELIDETSWVRESNQVAARQLVYGDAQPLLCHAPLKLDWK